MANAAHTSATWDDLLDVPEGYIGEIVAGELVMVPRPGPAHTETASDLGALLLPPLKHGRGGPGGWVILDEPRVAFLADIRVPDLAGWRAERYTRPEQGPYAVVSDWLCEVLSPSTATTDRTEKLPTYHAAQVPFLWLIDPEGCSLEVYRREPDGYLLALTARGDATLRVPPFEAIEIELGLLWGDRWTPPDDAP